jgi:hypothetical protein
LSRSITVPFTRETVNEPLEAVDPSLRSSDVVIGTGTRAMMQLFDVRW